MSDYFDSDQVTKGYDPLIMKRILGYMKPYWKSASVALLALLLSTVGELYMPLIVQKTIDEALMVSYRRIDAAMEKLPEAAGIPPLQSEPLVAGKRYVRNSRLSALTGKARAALEEKNIIEPGEFYVFRIDPKDSAQDEILKAHPSYFALSDGHAAIAKEHLDSLGVSDLKAIRSGDIALVAKNALVFFLILLAVLGTTFIQTWITSLMGQKAMNDIRKNLFEKTIRQSLGYLGRQPVGRLVTRLTNDVETINEFFTNVLVSFLKDSSVMVGVLAVLFILNWKLALISLLTLPPVLAATMISRIKARDAFRRQRKCVSKVNSFLSEHLSGASVVKLFAREAASAKEFEKHDAELMRANLGEMYVFAVFRPLIDFFAAVSTGCIIWFGASMFLSMSISLGILIAFVNLIRMFFSPVQDIAEKYTILQSAMAGGEKVFALMDVDEGIPDLGKAGMPEPFKGRIEFEKVSFAYRKGDEVIKDLSFKVAPGETVAIVGYTGAGKTTVANLITRLWDKGSGEIRLDGIPLGELSLNSLRSSVQTVLQDVFLFSGTISENIRLGAEMSEEWVREASRAACADEFISKLRDGYDTILSEGATNISAGQRQLISFARVLAHDPKVVILDEATSNIDTETEKLIQKGLSKVLDGRTSIVIAHRLSTIRHANRILVMAQGRLVEEGSHQALLRKRGIYWNLYRLQYEGGAAETEAV